MNFIVTTKLRLKTPHDRIVCWKLLEVSRPYDTRQSLYHLAVSGFISITLICPIFTVSEMEESIFFCLQS